MEEGDIVKQIDDFLVILQDGRLFSINTKPSGEDGLVLAGRQDVYLSDEVDTWYDEMLVSGNKIVVTGYSYDAEASEVSIFTLNPDGSFTREDTFYIASNDYYDSKNYATRIVGDKFIVHTPIYLSGYSPTDVLPWPVIRHWQKYLDFTEFEDWSDLPSNSLLRPQNIYRPIQGTIAPVIHTITICEIGAHRRNEMMECDASAFVALKATSFMSLQMPFSYGLGPMEMTGLRGEIETRVHARPMSAFHTTTCSLRQSTKSQSMALCQKR